jgi:hypothetical protein
MSTATLKPIGAIATVDALLREAFGRVREPRSREYMLGTHDLLLARFGITPMKCPYAVGTAAFDAYFAGKDEGSAIWLAHKKKAAQ